MNNRNIIQTTFDQYGVEVGGIKRSGSWYVHSRETIVVLNLQKSQFALKYFVNVAIWILVTVPAEAPKPSECQIQTRLDALLPPDLETHLNELLDLQNNFESQARHSQFLDLLRKHLSPAIGAASTLDGLRAGEALRLVSSSLVDGDGQRILQVIR